MDALVDKEAIFINESDRCIGYPRYALLTGASFAILFSVLGVIGIYSFISKNKLKQITTNFNHHLTFLLLLIFLKISIQ